MLHEILKQETYKHHQELEQLMFVDKIMDGTLSAKQYEEILRTNYIVHACFEKQIFESLDSELKKELDITKREKLAALQKDLAEINLKQPESGYIKNSFDICKNNASALGAMYVLEGATLGGNVIVKRLKVNQELQKLNLNFHYYQIYNANLVAYWKNFCQVLNTKVAEEDFQKSINSALKIFEAFAAAQKRNFIP